jgi:hypothetical protein
MTMIPPAGLADQQRRAKSIRLATGADWYLVERGRFDLVGSGDVSDADLRSVERELGDSGVFVCVVKPRPIEEILGEKAWGTRRIRRSAGLRAPTPPKLRWVAQGARLAVLPGRGTVWVDTEHLFAVDEPVPLPWTEPLVELVVVRPATVLSAMKAMVGPGGPARARLPWVEES